MVKVERQNNQTQGKLAHYEFPPFDPPYSITEPAWAHPEAIPLITFDLIIWTIADEVLKVAREVLSEDVTSFDITPDIFEQHLVHHLEQQGWEIEVHQPSADTKSVYYAYGLKS